MRLITGGRGRGPTKTQSKGKRRHLDIHGHTRCGVRLRHPKKDHGGVAGLSCRRCRVALWLEIRQVDA